GFAKPAIKASRRIGIVAGVAVAVAVLAGGAGGRTAAYPCDQSPGPPKLCIEDVTVLEGNGPNPVRAHFTVKLNAAQSSSVVAEVTTARVGSCEEAPVGDFQATPGRDYVPVHATVTF